MSRKQGLQPAVFLSTWLLCASLLFSACSAQDAGKSALPIPSQTPRTGDLTPFTYRSATPTLRVIAQPTLTLLPSPSPTPRTHVVKKGEDMLGIAFQYGITLEELLAANPEVKPNLMSVGTILIIPGSNPGAEIEATPGAAVQATALPVVTSPVFCAMTQDGGVWCSQVVHNAQDFPIEGLSAMFRLGDPQDSSSVSQVASLPLDLLQPGQSLPLATYFSPPLPAAFQASAEIISALPYADDGRYLPTHIEHQKVFLSENGLSAVIKVDLSLALSDSTARRIWIVATAYDQQGHVVGFRRWEKPRDQTLKSGEVLPASLNVYSAAGPIKRVELAAEARP